MITKNKLEQREVVMKSQGRKWVKVVILAVLLLTVAGGTLGLMWAIRGAKQSGGAGEDVAQNSSMEGDVTNERTVDEEARDDDNSENGELSASTEGGADGSADEDSGEVGALTGEKMDEAEATMLLGGVMGGYAVDYPGRSLEIITCVRDVAGNKIECELVDPMNGRELKVALLAEHAEWQWLAEHAVGYGFEIGDAPWRIVWYNE